MLHRLVALVSLFLAVQLFAEPPSPDDAVALVKKANQALDEDRFEDFAAMHRAEDLEEFRDVLIQISTFHPRPFPNLDPEKLTRQDAVAVMAEWMAYNTNIQRNLNVRLNVVLEDGYRHLFAEGDVAYVANWTTGRFDGTKVYPIYLVGGELRLGLDAASLYRRHSSLRRKVLLATELPEDEIAAKLAEERPYWKVVALLPIPRGPEILGVGTTSIDGTERRVFLPVHPGAGVDLWSYLDLQGDRNVMDEDRRLTIEKALNEQLESRAKRASSKK